MATYSEATWSREPTGANPVLLMRLATGQHEPSRRESNELWLRSWINPSKQLHPGREPIVLTTKDVDAVTTLLGSAAAHPFISHLLFKPAA